MLIGFCIGAPCNRPLSSEFQVLQRTGLVAASAKVIRQLRRYLSRAITPTLFLPPGDTPMELAAPAGRDALIKHLLIEGVIEAEGGRDGTIGPGDRPLRRDELLATREPRAA